VDRLAVQLVVQVPLQHGRQRPLPPQARRQGGQGLALPDGAGLPAGRPGLDHGQELVDLLGEDAGPLQSRAGHRQQQRHQLGRGQRPHPAPGPSGQASSASKPTLAAR
jgi:hypothetical protein